MTDRETIQMLAEKVMGIAPAVAAQLFLWNPLTDANATLECLERMDSWSRIGSKVDVCWKSCKWFRSSCNDFKIDACRAMIAAVEGRDA